MTAVKETLGFQTEVKQLLHLMIHSLYSNKEIFLRELISNASDAADKLRFEALSHPDLYAGDADLKVIISFDKKARTITLNDNGIGMSRQEVIDNLGTIARSGTREFLASLTGKQSEDAKLIGQFGVGFYSAFIVADKVTVTTRRADLPADQAVRWESKGEGEYTLEQTTKETRGTEIVLRLKKDENEFLDDWRLRHIITKYSDHITLPVLMQKVATDDKENQAATTEYETVNRATALWTLPKSEIKDTEYCELYKHIAHDFEDPLTWSHNRVEGKQEYTSLLYIPARAPFDLWNREQKRGLKLYVKRVFIMDDAEQFLPMYLRFIKGVIDSNDLPLNISREILQQNKTVETMRSALVKRVLSVLEKMASDEPENYAKFWTNFGQVLKEGIVEDQANKEQIAKLLRFASTHTDTQQQSVSLADYVARMTAGQQKIYYITAETFAAAKHSPQLEIFRKKNIEVLLLTDRVDEWVVTHLTEFDGKALQAVTKGNLDLPETDADQQTTEDKPNDSFTSLAEHIQKILGDKVKEVRASKRLTESPACIVADENDMNSHMQQILRAAGQDIPASKPIFELNPTHPLVKRLETEADDTQFANLAELLFDQALLADGRHLDDPASFVRRLNQVLLDSLM